eukprot:Protomagalhaensia_sp_Gyna_25__1189@NODE_158_length_4758_cov_17_038356_g123_i0_p2_GENE_NODE_158_length_4758_cov_17_038356_g123_i0NODE_158_length_4758_cov_17_038356_g123_i0_p2_ORF_typecomplete_len653_score127_53CLASP_N/PF12348_8/0_14CLASP_N/PF12348_8/8e07CLASP_N/PF12348_8/2_1e05CLASP_N/PF12348_8/0_0044HEAT_2/PF13646_6/0_81HEAT_2/PF13646_6/0_84HEAT_2/PF13646_6/0_052HEAT_2/PF13646_6/0_16HEAT_2/PF13646_6/2_5e05HEAT_2/PF13646_6/1_9HEAT_2/PF13646_6/0_85HEAT_2/PF13646_6/0_00042HEAT/PF02985_22/10HEAT/PF0
MSEGIPADSVSFFKKEFYEAAETPADQIGVLSNTRFICAAVDVPTRKTRLIPLLDEIARRGSIEDEVLFQVVQQLFEVSHWLEDSDEALALLLPTLEYLAQQEETVVRDAAVETVGRLLREKCRPSARSIFSRERLMPILERLLAVGSLPAKVSCCNLCPLVYEFLDQEKAESARTIFIDLSKDEVPLVRRAAASQFKLLVDRMESSDVVAHLLPTMLECWNEAPADTQDQLRCAILSALMGLARKVSTEEREQLLPVVATASYDGSWRIRLRLVQELPTLMASMPPSVVEEVLCIWLETAIRDPEPEVQAAAVEAMKACIPYMRGPELDRRLLPILVTLSEPELNIPRADEFSDVCNAQYPFTFAAGLAGLLGPIAKKLGKQSTEKQLLPLLTKFMSHALREVRNNAVEQLGDICEVLGPTTASEVLLPTFQAAITDQQWRIRLALVEQISRMARLFGPESFLKEEWEGLYFGALLDHAYAVRQAAVNSVVDIGSHFGAAWARDHLLENLLKLYDRAFSKGGLAVTVDMPPFVKTLQASFRPIESYTSRNTLLHALGKIALVVSESDVTDRILPRLLKSVNDQIPNVRFTSLSILAELTEAGRLSSATLEKTLLPKMVEAADDEDPDVQFFAAKATATCQRWLDSRTAALP